MVEVDRENYETKVEEVRILCFDLLFLGDIDADYHLKKEFWKPSFEALAEIRESRSC